MKTVQKWSFFLVRIFLYSVQVEENAGQKKKKLIWTLHAVSSPLKCLWASRQRLGFTVTVFLEFSETFRKTFPELGDLPLKIMNALRNEI